MFLGYDNKFNILKNIPFHKKMNILYFPLFSNKNCGRFIGTNEIKYDYTRFQSCYWAPYFSFSKFIDKTMNLRHIKFATQFISLETDSLRIKCYDNYNDFVIAKLSQNENEFFIDLR